MMSSFEKVPLLNEQHPNDAVMLALSTKSIDGPHVGVAQHAPTVAELRAQHRQRKRCTLALQVICALLIGGAIVGLYAHGVASRASAQKAHRGVQPADGRHGHHQSSWWSKLVGDKKHFEPCKFRWSVRPHAHARPHPPPPPPPVPAVCYDIPSASNAPVNFTVVLPQVHTPHGPHHPPSPPEDHRWPIPGPRRPQHSQGASTQPAGAPPLPPRQGPRVPHPHGQPPALWLHPSLSASGINIHRDLPAQRAVESTKELLTNSTRPHGPRPPVRILVEISHADDALDVHRSDESSMRTSPLQVCTLVAPFTNAVGLAIFPVGPPSKLNEESTDRTMPHKPVPPLFPTINVNLHLEPRVPFALLPGPPPPPPPPSSPALHFGHRSP